MSELVTNAVIHAQTPLNVTVSLTSSYIEVSVRDRNSGTECHCNGNGDSYCNCHRDCNCNCHCYRNPRNCVDTVRSGDLHR